MNQTTEHYLDCKIDGDLFTPQLIFMDKRVKNGKKKKRFLSTSINGIGGQTILIQDSSSIKNARKTNGFMQVA